MKCPTCGAENDAANRFCDQCGSRIEASSSSPQAQEPSPAALTCPTCGAAILPGEAFCDECGSALSSVAPTPSAVSADAPTVFIPTPAGSTTTGGDQGS